VSAHRADTPRLRLFSVLACSVACASSVDRDSSADGDVSAEASTDANLEDGAGSILVEVRVVGRTFEPLLLDRPFPLANARVEISSPSSESIRLAADSDGRVSTRVPRRVAPFVISVTRPPCGAVSILGNSEELTGDIELPCPAAVAPPPYAVRQLTLEVVGTGPLVQGTDIADVRIDRWALSLFPSRGTLDSLVEIVPILVGSGGLEFDLSLLRLRVVAPYFPNAMTARITIPAGDARLSVAFPSPPDPVQSFRLRILPSVAGVLAAPRTGYVTCEGARRVSMPSSTFQAVTSNARIDVDSTGAVVCDIPTFANALPDMLRGLVEVVARNGPNAVVLVPRTDVAEVRLPTVTRFPDEGEGFASLGLAFAPAPFTDTRCSVGGLPFAPTIAAWTIYAPAADVAPTALPRLPNGSRLSDLGETHDPVRIECAFVQRAANAPPLWRNILREFYPLLELSHGQRYIARGDY